MGELLIHIYVNVYILLGFCCCVCVYSVALNKQRSSTSLNQLSICRA